MNYFSFILQINIKLILIIDSLTSKVEALMMLKENASKEVNLIQ
jgi:hypothetical protein